MIQRSVFFMLALLAVASSPVKAANDYIWCVVQSSVDSGGRMQGRAVYSSVFAGDYAERQTYEGAFWSFVDSRMGLGQDPQVTCHYEASSSESREARDSDAATAKNTYKSTTLFTNWSY